MKTSKKSRRVASSVFRGLAVAHFVAVRTIAKQKVDARGLTFEAPPSWKSSPPPGQDARAELKAQPIEGDRIPG